MVLPITGSAISIICPVGCPKGFVVNKGGSDNSIRPIGCLFGSATENEDEVEMEWTVTVLRPEPVEVIL